MGVVDVVGCVIEDGEIAEEVEGQAYRFSVNSP